MSYSTIIYNEYIYLIERKIIELEKINGETSFLLKSVLNEILNYITSENNLNYTPKFIKNYLKTPVCIIKLANAILLLNPSVTTVNDIYLLLGNCDEIKE